MKCPTPLSRQCGAGKRRTSIDGTKRKRVDQLIEERVPEWLIRQAAKARAA
jgi:hypothetical protein